MLYRQHLVMPRDFLQPGAEELRLYPFRFRDPVSRKWVRARYVAERHEIEARYTVWEIVGQPEYRRPVGGSFDPWRPVTTPPRRPGRWRIVGVGSQRPVRPAGGR